MVHVVDDTFEEKNIIEEMMEKKFAVACVQGKFGDEHMNKFHVPCNIIEGESHQQMMKWKRFIG
jgi:hypothetical protein